MRACMMYGWWYVVRARAIYLHMVVCSCELSCVLNEAFCTVVHEYVIPHIESCVKSDLLLSIYEW